MKKLWIALLMLPVLLGLSTCARVKYVPDYHAQQRHQGLGRAPVTARSRVPSPPAIMTAFMLCPPAVRKDWISPVFAGGVEIISCEYGGVLVYYKLVSVSAEQRETD